MKQFFAVVLFLVVLFPAVSDEYKICYSSVTLEENAEYIARGLENNGIQTVFEPTVVFNRDYIRILSAETYTSLQEALRVKNALAGKSFARTLGLTSMWIRAYPEGYPASGFVSTDIPEIPGRTPRPAEPARTTAQPAPAAAPTARPAPSEPPATAPAPKSRPAAPAEVPEITAAPPAPEAEPAATPEPPAPQPEPEPPVQAEPAPPAAPPVRSVEPASAPAAEPEPAAEPPVEPAYAPAATSPVEAEPPADEPEAEPEPVPDIPEPAAGPASEPVPEVEPEAEPVTEDIPEVVEEEAPEPAAAATAEVTIKPKAAPEAPAKSKPEVPAVEDGEPPAAPKPEKDVPADLTPPVEEEMPAEPTPPAVPEEEPEPMVEEEVPEEPAAGEAVEEEPMVEQPVVEEEPPAAEPPAAEEAPEEPAVVEEVAEAVQEEPEAGAAPVEESAEEQPVAEEPAAEPAVYEALPEDEGKPFVPPEPTSTEPDAVFAFHRDNFLSAYEYLRTFADEGDSEEAARLAGSIPMFLDMAEAILEDFAAYLPDPLSDYEKENPEAKDIRLASKASFLENTYIPDARENLESLKNDILAAMESDAEWLASEYANIKHAPAALERIKDRAETLKTIASEDTDLLSRSQAVLAEAEESYATLSGKIAENRMPAEKYEEDDAAQLKAEMAVLYEALFPGEMVRKVVIVSEDWREEASAEIKDGKIVAGVYRYIQAALAITRQRDENATVYTIGFRRTWTGSGDDFGPVELYSIGSSYPILPEHIGE